jgi:predicted nucleic acid-binding protein
VLVSPLIADGPPRRVLEVVRDGRAVLVLPQPALVELERVLREKLGLGAAAVAAIVALVEELACVIEPAPASVQARSGDPADDRIIAAALAGSAEVLVSGDRKHVLPLKQVGPMRILRPQDLLAELAT